MNIKQMVDRSTILKIVSGSHMYGTNTVDSDKDYIGICIPTKDYILGMHKFEQLEERTNPSNSNKQNTRADNDYTCYSLPKFIKLAYDNNPNVLEVLFAPEESVVHWDDFGKELLASRHLFVSKRAYYKFMGYAIAQKRKLFTKQPEGLRTKLIEKHGYDCYVEGTEFLTDKGWKKYDEITGGMRLGTVNRITKKMEFQNFTSRAKQIYSGKIFCHKSNHSSFGVTLNHKLYLSRCHRRGSNNFNVEYKEDESSWSLIPISEIIDSKKSVFHFLTSSASSFESYPVGDEYLKLLGFFIAEGTFCKFKNNGTPRSMRISQTDRGKALFIKEMEAIAPMYGFRKYKYKRNYKAKRKEDVLETVWVSYNRQIVSRLFGECGHMSKNKKLPNWCFLLSQRQANLLLEALMLGDGYNKNRHHDVYYTASKELAGDIQIVSILAGKDCAVCGPYTSKTMFSEKCGMYHVRINSKFSTPKVCAISPFMRKDYKKPSLFRGGSMVQYNGNVVCFSVPNEILITRLNGKIAIQGNSKYASHLIRLLYFGVEILRTGELILPTEHRKYLIQIKNGEWPLSQIIDKATYWEEYLEQSLKSSALPEYPDIDKTNKLQIGLIERFWDTKLLQEELCKKLK